jgi:L-ectoine synthase
LARSQFPGREKRISPENLLFISQLLLRENKVCSNNYIYLNLLYLGENVVIFTRLEDVVGTERDVAWGNGQSRRFLLEKDGMGYSMTDTVINAGTESLLEYRNHMETCYCIEGEGEVEVNGVVYPIQPGSMYALNQNDKHYLRAKTTMRLVCVFNPPLQGVEAHNLQGKQSSCY